MFTLFHHSFCPHSRFVRLALGEYGLEPRLAEERVWERREAFLGLFGALIVSLLAGSATIPYVAYHFHRISTYGVLGNLLAMPVASGVRLEGFAGKPFGGLVIPAKSRLLSGVDRIPPRGV